MTETQMITFLHALAIKCLEMNEDPALREPTEYARGKAEVLDVIAKLIDTHIGSFSKDLTEAL